MRAEESAGMSESAAGTPDATRWPTAEFPLSTAQLSWWAAQQLDPTVPNTVAMYLDATGPVQVDVLRDSAAQAARELQSPHVRFRLAHGTPVQYLAPDAFTPMTYRDLTGRPDAVATALEWMERDHRTPLNLLTDRLTIARTFRVGPDRHLLYLRSHHIVLDGVGAAQVLRRTAELYAAATGFEQAPVGAPLRRRTAPGPLTIADLLADEHAYAASARAQTDRAYWSQQLAGMAEPARLAGRTASRPRPPHRVAAPLPAPLPARLKAWRQWHGYTFPELTIAAFGCYLAAMTGAAEVPLSLPVTARPTAALQRSAGSMSNVVPLRMTGFRDATVADTVDRVRSLLIGAVRHQRYRYADIQRDRGEHRTARGGFGPVVNMLRTAEPMRMGRLSADVHLLALGPIEDLLVSGYQLGPDERSITLDLQGNPELYSADALAAHHRQFTAYFDRFLSDPHEPIRRLDPPRARPVTPAVQPHRLLPDLLRRTISGGDPATVRRARDTIAVEDGGLRRTYGELDRLSSQWARELIGSGVGPGDFVLVALPRSAESVLALWSVAKTGAAFVPVDPADPPARIASIAADSGARRGLSVTDAGARLPAAVDWLLLDDPRPATRVREHSDAPIRDRERTRPLRPDCPAYLIHTSGTTGVPKGVVVTHRGLGPLTDHVLTTYRVDRTSRILHAHAPAFDAHLLEVLSAFAGGARLIIEPTSVVAGTALAELLRDTGITHFLTTPAVLATLSPEQAPALRVVVVGGEQCPAELVRRWGRRLRLHNGYGPTETTVMVTQSTALDPDGPVTIGPPLPGVQTLILDDRLRPAPPCGAGELYLGGPGVADGYRGRPGDTADRFVADPRGGGGRVYRTGDLVRAAADGALEFLGRSDEQLSLRGRRAEPGEVETALTSLPDIRSAAVTVRDDPRGARLTGYVVATPGVRLDHADITRRLRELLPAALVPAQLVDMDRLPLTARGKLDRTALPAPGAPRRPFRAPETEIERLVAAHFAAATGAGRVGRDDDFFELGGNSLLGVSVSADLAAATGLPVTVRWLYTAPTPRELAARLEGAESDGDDALGVVLALRRGGSRPPLFCVHSAVPLAWCYSGLARELVDRPVYGLQAPTLTGSPSAGAHIDDLADSYADEILRIQPTGPCHLLGWSLGGQIAHAVAIRLRARGAVATLAMLDSVVVPDGVAAPPPPRMRDLLTHLLGDEPDDADALPDVSADEAAAELARAGASFGTGLTAEQLTRLHRGYADGVRLAHGYRPGVFPGDLLYFSATRGVTASLDARMWRPFVAGALAEHPVEATHAQLCNADVVRVIGPLLDTHLTRADRR